MKIEAGKYYKTRDGRTVKVIEDDGTDRWPLMVDHGQLGRIWHGRDGVSNLEDRGDDLIATACPEQGTLKEIGAKQGDTVEWIGCGERIKHFVTEICGTEAILLEDGDDPSERFEWPMDSEYRTWRIISRANETPKSPIRTVTRKEIVPGCMGR